MAIKINPSLKQFYLFLEKHNALIAWENNRITKYPDETRAEFFARVKLDGYRFIIGAFTWVVTPEGQIYWSTLHSKWCDEAGV